MISKFSLLSGKPKKALCGVFCGRSVFEFNDSWNLEQKFCLIARVKDYKLQKEQRSEETISNLKIFSSKYNTLLKI